MKKSNLSFIITIALIATLCISYGTPTRAINNQEKPFHIFLLLGQSNMKGRGKIMTLSAGDSRIKMLSLNKTVWETAQHPLHKVDPPDNAGVGPGLSFAKAYLEKNPGVTIGLVPCAKGGSSIKLWTKENDLLYKRAVERGLYAARDGELKGILWLQGESDCQNESQALSYQQHLVQMVSDLRSDLKVPELPFVCATIGSFLEEDRWPYNDYINEVLMNVGELISSAACADVRYLSGHIGDNVHYNTASQIEIGIKMAESFFKISQQK